jgi:LCP family protein required for cell wall assembly
MMKKGLLKKILFVEVAIALLAFVFIMIALWNRPLGPGLDLASPVTQASTESPKEVAQGLIVSPTVSAPTATPPSVLAQIVSLFNAPAAEAKTLCNGPISMTILLIGSDERSEGYLYGLADSIRLVRVDFVNPGVQTLDIPRDLWVEIPGISDHYDITHGKLNQAYFFGNPGMGYYDGPGEGPGLTARTLQQNFGVNVDHYVAVDIKTFIRMVDTLDGIDIYNAATIDLNQNHDGENPAYVLEPGVHHLDGSMALRLAMNRYPTIFQRAINQDIVLSALQSKLLSPAMLPRLPSLINDFTRSVQTDLSPNDINKLVCISHSLTSDNTQMLSFPVDMFTSDHVYDPYRKVYTYVMQADFTQMGAYFSDFLEGRWP